MKEGKILNLLVFPIQLGKSDAIHLSLLNTFFGLFRLYWLFWLLLVIASKVVVNASRARSGFIAFFARLSTVNYSEKIDWICVSNHVIRIK